MGPKFMTFPGHPMMLLYNIIDKISLERQGLELCGKFSWKYVEERLFVAKVI
jgi:hypothetical protein